MKHKSLVLMLTAFFLAALLIYYYSSKSVQEPGRESLAREPISFLNAPPRPENSLSGSEFAAFSRNLTRKQRQTAVMRELQRGNIPDFLRTFVPVAMESVRNGDTLRAIIRVAPDYLSIGANQNFIRIPLSYQTAAAIAENFGCALPTQKMADAVCRQAEVKLTSPAPALVPFRNEGTLYQDLQRKEQKLARTFPRGRLAAGHRRDLIVAGRSWNVLKHAALYSGCPDQEPAVRLVYLFDGQFPDHAAGVRLVSSRVLVNGREMDIRELRRDSSLARVLAYEGPLRKTRKNI
ncbi:hypothetical protein ACFL5V_06840 [Fibrobacterota bacterium]